MAPTSAVPVTAVPPSAVATTVPASMVPTTAVPTPSPSAVALAADAAVCEAALHCCEAAAREARMAARMEGIDPRFDPRGRLGGKFDEPIDEARHSAPARLAQGCRELRSGEAAHADRCASQIDQLRRAFREVPGFRT